MKPRKDEILTTVLFCGFLAAMFVCYLLLPKKTFSEKEKRYLAESPQFSWQTLADGQLGGEVETYMADHIPGRDFFVGLNGTYDLVTGRQITSDVRLLKGDRLVEAPVLWNQAAAEKNMRAINSFAEAVDTPVDLMLVPSAGWAATSGRVFTLDLFSRENYEDASMIESIHGLAGEKLNCVDILAALENQEDYYYRTDHHWTSEGAYMVYGADMEQLGKAYPERDAFRVERVSGFTGSNYARSALWQIPGEELELWHGTDGIQVVNGEDSQIHEGIFYPHRLEETDKYTVFLDGNHSTVRLDNPRNAGQGKILVIRDSYCNVFGGFLAESYETVVLVDLRYYKNPVSQLLAEEEFDRVLICYSIGNFMTDSNIIWLR